MNILTANGSDMEHVIKTTVFLKDISEFARMNGVYATFFGENPPARSAVQVAALPKGGAVEIEAVAAADSGCCCDCGGDCEDCEGCCDCDGNCSEESCDCHKE